jgi:hypothetical protein
MLVAGKDMPDGTVMRFGESSERLINRSEVYKLLAERFG